MPGIVDFIAGLAQGGTNPQTGQPNTIGERLLNGVTSMDEGYNNFAANSTKAKALRQVVAAYAQDEPDPDKQKNIVGFAHTAGLGDLEGFVQAHANKLTQQKQQADIQEQQARGQYYNSFAGYRDQQAADAKDDDMAGQWAQHFMTAPGGGSPSSADTAAADVAGTTAEGEGEPSVQDRAAYASKMMPGMSGKAFLKVPDFLAKWQAATQGFAGKAVRPGAPTPSIVTQKDEDGNAYHAWFEPTTGKYTPLPAGVTKAMGIPPTPTNKISGGLHWAWRGPKTGWVTEKDAALNAGTELQNLLNGSTGGAATDAATATPAMRFRKNPDTGKIEQY